MKKHSMVYIDYFLRHFIWISFRVNHNRMRQRIYCNFFLFFLCFFFLFFFQCHWITHHLDTSGHENMRAGEQWTLENQLFWGSNEFFLAWLLVRAWDQASCSISHMIISFLFKFYMLWVVSVCERVLLFTSLRINFNKNMNYRHTDW